MDQVLRGLTFAYNYIDYLLMANKDSEEHKNHIHMVYERLQNHGILINPSKCELSLPQLQSLGHHIDSQGIHHCRTKYRQSRSSPQPTTMRKLREILGSVNFYHRFLPNAAHILQRLHKLLGATKRGSVMLQWSSNVTLAFIVAKEALAERYVIRLSKAKCSDVHYV